LGLSKTYGQIVSSRDIKIYSVLCIGMNDYVSLPVPSPTGSPRWMEWSHAWGREMALRRALEKLNLEYPADSN
jgi:hypothetical protein